MRLSALDIKKKEFQQKMRGADPEEVRAFLALASEEVEQLAREKKESEEQRTNVTARLEHFLALEQTLEKTLSAAQSTAVNMESQARREADLILREAQLERDRMLGDIRLELQHADSELIRLRGEYESTVARMKALLAGFSTFLESIEREPSNAIDTTRDIAGPLQQQPASAPIDSYSGLRRDFLASSLTGSGISGQSGLSTDPTPFQDYEH